MLQISIIVQYVTQPGSDSSQDGWSDCRRRSRIAPTSWCFETCSTSLEEARDASPNRVRDCSSKGETWKAFALSCFLSRDLLSSKTPKRLCRGKFAPCVKISGYREESINDPPGDPAAKRKTRSSLRGWTSEKEAILPCVTMSRWRIGSCSLAGLSPLLALARGAVAVERSVDLSRTVGPFWSDIRFHRPSWHWTRRFPAALSSLNKVTAGTQREFVARSLLWTLARLDISVNRGAAEEGRRFAVG